MKTYKLKSGNTLKIVQDDTDDNPRSWDNLAKMIFFNKYKNYGDDHDVILYEDFNSREDFMTRGTEIVAKKLNAVICKPVHWYSHSGESISTSYSYPYNCRWDSGTIGFAVVTKEDIRKEYGVKKVTKKHIEKADRVLEGEVEILNQYISGDVWGFQVVDNNDNIVDSCYGFYGSDIHKNGMIEHINDEIIESELVS